ncbi:unnamed protein product [Effrenium voratum]|uniref:Uncharacterized protein n=1 Tax=Effrenium voratum TaxID=2562239 RepID=A0AA36IKD4_9DINO|nr:unnamed protein product [Effrenium voratum]
MGQLTDLRLAEELGARHGVRGTSFQELPELKEHVGRGVSLEHSKEELKKSIDAMNSAWASGRETMEKSYGKVHTLKKNLDSNWHAGRDALEAACTRLRDTLDKAGEDRVLCEEAQSSTTEGLPALFLKRFKDPMRFAQFQGGVIHGCTKQFDSDECNCPSGHEELGCQDAADPASFELKCSNVLNTQIPAAGVLDFFKSGGLCNISNHDELFKQVVDSETLHHLEESGMPLDLAFLWEASRLRRPKQRGMDFLSVASPERRHRQGSG